MVVILISGRPLVITQQLEQADAFVAAWLPGSEGDGIAEILFGKYDFKGRLSHSWPKSEKDFGGKYGPNHWDASITPLFLLGYGLQYNQTKKAGQEQGARYCQRVAPTPRAGFINRTFNKWKGNDGTKQEKCYAQGHNFLGLRLFWLSWGNLTPQPLTGRENG